MLYSRSAGRTTLYVDTAEVSTLAGGRPRAISGTDTRYVVRAMANRSRTTVVLGSFPTLDQAREYCLAWTPRIGLKV